jgi:hypothetical protein
MKKQPKVSIVFVNWNGKKDTFGLIESLKKIIYQNYEIIVIDNGSSENISSEFKKKYSKIATLIETKKNLGLAEGTNIGIRLALKQNAEYVLVMNNDMYVKEDFLNILVDNMEKHPEVAVSGPKIYYAEPPNMIWCAGCKYRLRGYKSLEQGVIDNKNNEDERYVDGLDCVLMFRSEELKKLGILNSKLFLLHEFTEWCLRATLHKLKCLYVPKSVVWHKVNATFEREKNKNEMMTYYNARNWLIVIKENKSFFYFLFILLLQSTIFAISRFLRYSQWKKPKLIKAYYIGIWHALINKTPMKLYSH